MSAGRFVVVPVAYNQRWEWPQWLQRQGDKIPLGTTVITSSAHGDMRGGEAWLGVAFPAARAAAGWIAQECEEWDEDPDEYERFTTVREMESHLSELSYRGLLGMA